MCADVRSCKRLVGIWTTCGRGVRGGVCDLCACAHGCRPRRVGVPVCVPLSLHHLLQLPSQAPIPTGLSKPTARQCPPAQMHAPRCSVHQCVLDQEKTKLSGGAPVPGPPSPCPLCCVIRMGAFSPAPSTICCFPRSLRPKALRRVPGGAPHPTPHL